MSEWSEHLEGKPFYKTNKGFEAKKRKENRSLNFTRVLKVSSNCVYVFICVFYSSIFFCFLFFLFSLLR